MSKAIHYDLSNNKDVVEAILKRMPKQEPKPKGELDAKLRYIYSISKMNAPEEKKAEIKKKYIMENYDVKQYIEEKQRTYFYNNDKYMTFCMYHACTSDQEIKAKLSKRIGIFASSARGNEMYSGFFEKMLREFYETQINKSQAEK